MIKRQLARFLIRWFLSTLAMLICIHLFCGFKEGFEWLREMWWFYALAGLLFSIVNSVVKPIATIFALPMLFITLGVFRIVVNAAMVGLTIWLIPGVTISFGGAILSCILISIMNYLANFALSDVK